MTYYEPEKRKFGDGHTQNIITQMQLVFKALQTTSCFPFSGFTVGAGQSAKIRQAEFVMNRHLFLASPDYLELKYVINPWMRDSKEFSLARAKQQHEALIETYRRILGGTEHITVIKPAPGLTELCFFGDSIFAIGKKALYGRLFCPERFAETEYAIEVTKALGFEGSRVPENMSFEGSGETLVWGEKILIGYGLRNSKEVVSYFKDYFAGGPEVIGLKLVDPYMYHLDTALFPVSNELVAVYNHAFDEKSNQVLSSLDCELLHVDFEDVKNFALNSVALGQDVVVHYAAKKFIQQLEQRGFRVHPVDVSEFMKFGGGLKCLTFQQYLF